MEEWKGVVGWGDYEVSDEGRVRRVRWPDKEGIRYLVQNRQVMMTGKVGYMRVSLIGREGDGGYWGNKRKHVRMVHRLVAETFIGPAPDGKEVNHIDGDKLNNHWGNLEWVTHAENMQKAGEMGLIDREAAARRIKRMWEKRRGEGWKVSNATKKKMSEAKLGRKHWRTREIDLGQVMQMRMDGMRHAEIASELGVGRTVIGDIFRCSSWQVRDLASEKKAQIRQIEREAKRRSPAEKCGG